MATRLSRLVMVVALSVSLFSSMAFAKLIIGSSNTAFADPPIPRPKTQLCKVVLYLHERFDDFNPRNFTYTPPADCSAPWAKVIVMADLHGAAGATSPLV